jgi:hypothetical protein
MGLTPHSSTEVPKQGEVIRIGNLLRRRVAVNDDGFILDLYTSSLIITPDPLGSRKRRGPTKQPPEDLQCFRDPIILVYRGDPIPFDTWNEEYDQDGFSTDLKAGCFHKHLPLRYI